MLGAKQSSRPPAARATAAAGNTACTDEAAGASQRQATICFRPFSSRIHVSAASSSWAQAQAVSSLILVVLARIHE